jgi:hypothetical protein
MEEKKISIDKIKAILSMLSMALLSIQHLVGLIADNASVSYIPLTITFLTIFISSLDTKETKWIRKTSFAATVLIVLPGCILYTIQSYGISINESVYGKYIKVMFLCIGLLSLILSVLYIKRIRELK